MKIFLDPGHGGHDPGAVANGLQEKDLVLTISKQIRDILTSEFDGVEVTMSRESDRFLSLTERANAANRCGADYFCSIHINAGGGTGFETFIHPNPSRESGNAQNIIHPRILAEMNVRDRGKKSANFAVLRQTNMPAILTENLFIDNPADAALLKEDQFITKIARGHAEGIADAFGLKRRTGSASVAKKQKAAVGASKQVTTSGYDLIQRYFSNVSVLQRQLMAVGEDLSRYRDDGVAGKETLTAIKSFQRKERITVDGIPGPVTQSRLLHKLQYSRVLYLQNPMMKGEDVRQVQRVVNVNPDSLFGPQTERGARHYQQKHGLTVDGKVGPQTWGHMFG
ncbi:N-acetylmuramoyl-L-alanine amidase [Halalkalibacterium halodurans]|uniref:N-acetylmuramoyl-L-alanine amidase (Sporulation mother cell wall hydrolase) n=1 Tax=Halalkalibacterium halodurans (strain ATCC BAA-125 / DSM 18197 / FERM 7344 / JCM 9153 / C-125) TaxID=272558 RepID=Q9KE90_HALH5|nr:N-acetylmuramoyl-L-alanine amidase [Halalkalibacterium halodurans]MED4082657.1 N-acetylmuramoyl-L-alanine amidase [Halalkalibacterium halodurans]MED4086562.1 N-acetylmuramoyl-L-alanine amidase [Halalkalibacterium halodurans]MED4103428.1 N-acetylmuramoyl-L-alanine amidase [Halalkalibacterium halodurans]MED4111149.1 N-acetylmuramoyl-L-alanine amidase [Halalkalibacterium halodurans]MED4126384.1 N-acetylmuramoyl-L-alanine amidase [Halalkalibacterium halodurans]